MLCSIVLMENLLKASAGEARKAPCFRRQQISTTAGSGVHLSVQMAIQEPTFLKREDGLKSFTPEREAAWFGLLAAHAELTRGLDACLSAKHGLTLSAYEVLSRLAHAEEGHLRMSELAGQTQLSLSRVSRVIDVLCERGLAERKSCPGDSRVVHATITGKGSALFSDAQDTFFETVD